MVSEDDNDTMMIKLQVSNDNSSNVNANHSHSSNCINNTLLVNIRLDIILVLTSIRICIFIS